MITAAFAFAAEVGLAEMSMPQLARRIGLPVTTIYWHFRTRDNLLNAMLERAVDQYHFAHPFIGDGAPWDEALKAHFRKMRLVFRDNPVLCDLVLLRSGEVGPESTHAAIEKLEAVVQTLVEAGFSADNALEVYLALSVHSRGSAILEHINAIQQLPNRVMHDRVQATGVSLEYTPLLFELTNRGRTIVDLNFEFTLDAIITKAQLLLAEDKASRRKKPAKQSRGKQARTARRMT